jgi:hypothetical protein
LAALFRFTDTGWFDGAAAEGHCAILFGLLQRWGDRPFSRVLRAQKQSVRKAVFDAISPMPGWSRSKYPLTYASAPTSIMAIRLTDPLGHETRLTYNLI